MPENKNTKNRKFEAALDYQKRGWAVLPLHTVVKGLCSCSKKEECSSPGKHPRTKNGVKDATKDPEKIQAWWTRWPNSNIGLATGEISGRVVLDVDIKKGKRGEQSLADLEQEFGALPKTLTSQTGSGGWHYVFTISKPVDTTVTDFREGLDFMGHKGYIVAPPSEGMQGSYNWLNQLPEADCPEWLLDVVYKDGKKKKAIKSTKPKQERDCSKLIKKLLPKGEESNGEWITHCPFPPHEDNNPSFYVCLANGLYKCFSCPAQGNLVQLYAHIKGVSLDEANQALGRRTSVIEELNQKHAVTTVGGKCVILTETWDPVFQHRDIVLSGPHDLRLLYQNRVIFDGEKPRPIVEVWLRHPKRRQYESIIFAPNQEVPGHYNLWKGFAVEPKSGDCDLYLKHLRDNISRKDEAIYQYLVGWMAHVVQTPEQRLGVAIVLRGKQGTGKGITCTEFGKLFGPHFTHVQHSRHLVGNFNAHLKQTVVLFADEAFWAGTKDFEGPLKAMITEEHFLMEFKGKDVIPAKNHIHLLIASNNEWVVPAGLEERRFFVLDVGEERMQDTTYFGALKQQMDNGGREALLYYLMHYDLQGVNLRKFPQTEALMEQKLQSMNDVQMFWLDKVMSGILPPTEGLGNKRCIRKDKLFQQYINHAQKVGHSRRSAETKLGRGLRKLVPGLKDEINSLEAPRKCWVFPSLQECRKAFDHFMNYSFAWPEGEEDWERNIDDLSDEEEDERADFYEKPF